jgi:hypothetical protein
MVKRIGVLVGRETSFPDALIAEINRRNRGVVAEMAKLGATPMNGHVHFDVLIDRISHEVPFYQSYLKNAALQGKYIINNPFWRIADDKFFGTSLAAKIGVHVPKTVMLPNKGYIPGIVAESLRNLEYPVKWDEIVAYTGLPAILKTHWGGGWKDVYKVNTLEELWNTYNTSDKLTLILQEFIQWEQYVRCVVVGRRDVLAALWNPSVPHFERYQDNQPPLSDELRQRCEQEALKLCDALGYDMNTVEFAIRDGVPYAIDFMNSAPDFDISSLGDRYFGWVVDKMANYAIQIALDPPPARDLNWTTFIGNPW